MELARAGFPVTGFDIDGERVRAVLDGRSYLVDISDEDLANVVRAGTLTATDDFTRIGEQDVLIICVPTPLGKSKAPDLSYIVSADDAVPVMDRFVALPPWSRPGYGRVWTFTCASRTSGSIPATSFIGLRPFRGSWAVSARPVRSWPAVSFGGSPLMSSRSRPRKQPRW